MWPLANRQTPNGKAQPIPKSLRLLMKADLAPA
jgi:hypothetical protein